MPRNQLLGKWTLRTIVTLLVVGSTTLIAWEGVQIFTLEIPNEAEWASSGHADEQSEAFRHWDGDGVVSKSCAKCHSGLGFQDFMGADGTEAGVVDNAPLPSVHTCVTCHNEATEELDSVVFPSGVEITGLNASAICMQCHQGRSSKASVDNKIADANVPDDDTVGKMSFQNIHYAAAGATLMGTQVMGGYQYAGKSYDIKFAHVEGIDSCIDCHNPHSLEVKIDKCVVCHDGVASREDLASIRHFGSTSDYDGDGNAGEGISGEIAGLQDILYGAIQSYAATTIGTPIVYDEQSHPYFFEDVNETNGQHDEGEGGYSSFTARLLKATYNYQASLKDHGAFAHNAKYMIQLLYDSIEDLDPDLTAGLERDDAGHFAGSTEPFRHWDEDGEVSGSCSKCHSATGLPFFLKEGVTASQPISNGFLCSTCHDSVPGYTRRVVESVVFPSGAELDTGDQNSNLCINCHQGRESGLSVEEAVAGVDADTIMDGQRFINVHYYAAGATLFGTEANGAYEYDGKTYKGRFGHVGSFDTCIECHDAHELGVQTQVCSMCHGVQDPHDIRKSSTDYDGDGDNKEGIAGEIDTLRIALLVAIKNYAVTIVGTPITYENNNPYFFTDTGERYATFTPRLLKAAYNYQYCLKDPGAFAHNGKYIIQVLYDSLENLGADVTGLVRP